MELGIEVRYLAFPRQGIDSDSYKKTVSIWCADDAKVMLTAAKNGEAVPNKVCDAPVANHYKLGRKLNLNGTPTLLFPDGSMFARFMAPEELAKFALEHQAGVK
jgi:thiol:disulfide interchange protein DsbC